MLLWGRRLRENRDNVPGLSTVTRTPRAWIWLCSNHGRPALNRQTVNNSQARMYARYSLDFTQER